MNYADYNGEVAISKRYLTQSHKEHREEGAGDKSGHIYARLSSPDRTELQEPDPVIPADYALP